MPDRRSASLKRFVVMILLSAGPIACPTGNEEYSSLGDETRVGEAQESAARAPTRHESTENFEDQLAVLGYVASEPKHADSGVVLHDSTSSFPGLNIYLSQHAREARLIDMNGETLHVWKGPATGSVETQRSLGGKQKANYWRTVRLYPDGSLLTQTDYGSLVKIDRNSRESWRYDERTHHDFDVREDGHIFVLIDGMARHERFESIIQDFVVEVDVDGNEIRRISIVDALIRGDRTDVLDELDAHQAKSKGLARMDLTHTNTLELLDGSLEAKIPAFRRGNLLLSFRTVHRLVVLDPEQEEVVWTMAGKFRQQHHPTMLPNGNILLFDNRGLGRRSQVLELDAATGEIVWSYKEFGSDGFFSQCCGRVHRLPNGNTLIVASNPGRAIEVTADGTPVWEFRNPNHDDENVHILSDVLRIPRDEMLWLNP